MRPLFLLFGVWHGFVSVLAGLYGAWLLVQAALSWYGGPFVVLGATLLISGLLTFPALGVAAQNVPNGGGKGTRSAGAVLALPCFAVGLWALEWSYWTLAPWTYTLPFLPGAILGALAMTCRDEAT